MAKYRKRPVIIEAIQHHAGHQYSEFAQDVIDGIVRYPDDDTMIIKTLEGVMRSRGIGLLEVSRASFTHASLTFLKRPMNLFPINSPTQ